jgi:3-dehydrosphinganine reductase
VVITGGSSGLGLEIARHLAPRGVRITLLARDTGRLHAAVAEVLAASPAAHVEAVSADVTDAPGLHAALARLARAGSIDVLLNSAGIIREGYFETLDDAVFRSALEVNLFGTINAIRAALPYLRESKGRIVNVASTAGLAGVFGFTPYCASKYALVGFTNALRFELEPQGIAVQLVCPAEFDSPMVADLDKTRTAENKIHVQTIPQIPLEQIAREVIAGVDARRRQIVPGRYPRLLVTAMRLAPGVAAAIGRRRIKTVYRGPDLSGNPSRPGMTSEFLP